jgi:hypothetical protein
VQLRYRGKARPERCLVARRRARRHSLEASLKWPQLRDWLAATPARRYRPLQGKLKTPLLEFEGVQLEGVEVEIGEGGSEQRRAVSAFAEQLLAWFERSGRHDLPWQHPRDPVPRVAVGDHAAADAGADRRSPTSSASCANCRAWKRWPRPTRIA